jgi:hypothetical protein
MKLVTLNNKKLIEKYDFQEAYLTRTRLMGVVGIRVHFNSSNGENLTVFLHLDFEEYGLDGLETYFGNSKAQVENISSRILYVLGSPLEKASYETVSLLIVKALKIGVNIPKHSERFLELFQIKEEKQEELILNSVEVIKSDYELINYFLMRYISFDIDMINILKSEDLFIEKIDFLCDYSNTLLKNTITPLDEGYISDSIISIGMNHARIRFSFSIKDRLIEKFSIEDVLWISEYEALMNLTREENIIVFELNNYLDGLERITRILDNQMINHHLGGSMITWFNKDNSHVNSINYYLNSDVKTFFYITKEGQLVLMSFEKNSLFISSKLIEKEFKQSARYMGFYDFKKPIMFEFIESGIENIFHFIM